MEKPQNIQIGDFDYPLPDDRIARHPLAQRDGCKLLVAGPRITPAEHVFTELPDLLPSDAMVIFNDTRVINARIRMHKSTGALIEIFCLEPALPADYALNFAATESCEWTCLVGNAKKWNSGALEAIINVNACEETLRAERLEGAGGSFRIRFSWTGGWPFADIIAAAGVIPIPPYLNRETEASDASDYQTVYCRAEGSVAAPTAGLHFTPELMEAMSQRGSLLRRVTLHVGAGTFRPVKSDSIGEHEMHSEFISVGQDLIADLIRHEGPVIAVGTTSVRTLESLYHIGCMIHDGKWAGELEQWYPYDDGHPSLSRKDALEAVARYLEASGSGTLVGNTRIIIAPGYDYRVVDGMVTNFHQPRSTLLLLVSAFLGGDRWRGIYDFALEHGFRFLSYGDACLFLRQ